MFRSGPVLPRSTGCRARSRAHVDVCDRSLGGRPEQPSWSCSARMTPTRAGRAVRFTPARREKRTFSDPMPCPEPACAGSFLANTRTPPLDQVLLPRPGCVRRPEDRKPEEPARLGKVPGAEATLREGSAGLRTAAAWTAPGGRHRASASRLPRLRLEWRRRTVGTTMGSC
jgi:hypothetical protein